ncbi:MAG: hypothetical protein AAF682_01225, partial [Planctomycetota bacterium]
MKRLLAFLLLFGAGVGALRWFQGPGTGGVPGAPEAVDEEWTQSDGHNATGLTPRGGLEYRSFPLSEVEGARPTLLHLTAEDSGRDEDGKHLFLSGAELRFLDPESNALRMRIDAERARVRDMGAGANFAPELGRKMTLEEVVVTVYEGAPIVPITARVPTLLVDLETRTMRTEEAVEIEGDLLTGSGLGMFVDEARSLLRLNRAGVLRFAPESIEGVLRSADTLELTRGSDEDPSELRIRATGGARLAPQVGDDGLDAETIELRGTEDEAGNFALTSIDAEQDVVYRLEGNEFRGKRAHVELDASGNPTRAVLGGTPQARLAFGGAAAARAPGTVDPDVAGSILIDSEAAMDVRWEAEGVRFETAGPAVVQSAEARLRSRGGLVAVSDHEGTEAELTFRDGVHLEREDAVLVTRELDATVRVDADGVAHLLAKATGRPLLTGTGTDGRELLLSARELLTFEQHGDDWLVPAADGVELTVLGEDGFRARAERVWDFDPRALSFRAEGNIQVESSQGTARGQSLVASGRDRFVLAGTEQRKATFESPDGAGEARELVRDGALVTFRGDVTARFEPSERGGEVYDLSCDELSVSRTELGGAAGTDSLFDLEAKGNVTGSVERPEDRLEVTCAHLVGHHEETLGDGVEAGHRSSNFAADGVERAFLVRQGQEQLRVRLGCERLSATRIETYAEDGPPAVEGEAIASGTVVFQGFLGEDPFEGAADELRIDHAGNASVLANERRTVSFTGALPSSGRPFDMSARWVEVSPERLEAHLPNIRVSRMETGKDGAADVDIHASAQHMISTETWLEFRDDVLVDGITDKAIPWNLDADLVRFEGRLAAPEDGGEVTALLASGDVALSLPGRDMRATGETVRAKTLSGLMRLEGSPARIESPTLVHEADWIELDVNLGFVVGSGKGRMRPMDEDAARSGPFQDDEEDDEGEWTIQYLSSRTLVEPDALVYILQEPEVSYTGKELDLFLPVLPSSNVTVSASWAIFWVDRQEWTDLGEGEDAGAQPEPEEPEAQEGKPKGRGKKDKGPRGFFGRIRDFGILSEVYLEGPVEVRLQDRPGAFASAVYLDVISGHGWLADASFTIDGQLIGRDFRKVQVQARWLRQSEDTSFHADEATIALCEFDDPHVQITTGDFQITPQEEGRYNIQLRDNRVDLYDVVEIPLPSIDYTSSKESLKPDWANLRIGNSARFGSFVSAGIVRPANSFADSVHGFLGRGADIDVADAEYSVDASWLGSRGVLLDLGAQVQARDEYWWTAQLGGVPDDAQDRGYVRVDEDDRDTLRLWFRTHGRYFLDPDQWLEIVGSVQSDAAVQSEFFERDFERYERSESYLRWRKADDANFYSANVKVPSNEFFTDIDELPSVGAWRGRSQLLPLGPTSLVYSAEARAAYLERRESDDGFASPFGLPEVFADGLGDREVLRFDTTHRLETPFDLGALGLRATPFAL